MKMNHYAKCAAAVLLCSFMYGPLSAQETEFDLSSQRSEKQDVRAVPGEKIDHHGLIINPTPHQLKVDKGTACSISQGVKLKDKQGKFAAYLDFLSINKKGIKLTIDFGPKTARKAGVKEVSGAYSLIVSPKEITLIGYDARGAFYGIQTLKQLAESPISAQGALPCVEINDYPDLPNRGVVEGFYGTPWSHDVRLSLIDFYGKFKMNTYLYGPKDDPYHSCPNWRLPYPEKEAQHIKELVEACNRNYVDFVWAIHPGQDIKWNEEDYHNLVQKFNWMYDLGVRHFAIFFDDISGEGTNPLKQTELLNRLTEEFVKVKGDVSPLTVCPTDYSGLWANPTEKGSLAIYGKTLNPDIKVFWTGDVVCSDMTPETLEFINSRIKRPAYYWWNYPVTDYIRNFLLQGPGRGITMEDGTLVFPIQFIDKTRIPNAGIMYSKDHGKTWTIHHHARTNTTEAQVAEVEPGTLMLNMRDNRGGSRAVYTTQDLGKTWKEHESSRTALIEPVCMASLISVKAKDNVLGKDLLIFSNPNSTNARKDMTIKISLDGGNTWSPEHQLLLDEGCRLGLGIFLPDYD